MSTEQVAKYWDTIDPGMVDGRHESDTANATSTTTTSAPNSLPFRFAA